MSLIPAAELLARGVTAARLGARSLARTRLARSTELASTDPETWVWLAAVSDSPLAALDCIERALALDPDHRVAQAGHSWYQALVAQSHESKTRAVPGFDSTSHSRSSSQDQAGDAANTNSTVLNDSTAPEPNVGTQASRATDPMTVPQESLVATPNAAVCDGAVREPASPAPALAPELEDSLPLLVTASFLPEFPLDDIQNFSSSADTVLSLEISNSSLSGVDTTVDPHGATVAVHTMNPAADQAATVATVLASPPQATTADVSETSPLQTLERLEQSIANDIDPVAAESKPAESQPLASPLTPQTKDAADRAEPSAQPELPLEMCVPVEPADNPLEDLGSAEWQRWLSASTLQQAMRPVTPVADTSREIVADVSERLATAVQRVLAPKFGATTLVNRLRDDRPAAMSDSPVAGADHPAQAAPTLEVNELQPAPLTASTVSGNGTSEAAHSTGWAPTPETSPQSPLQTEHAETPESSLLTEVPANPEPESQANRPVTILVVDDSATIRRVVSDILQPRGYRVFEAADGIAGIREIARHRPDLILLDITMPRLDGYRLCRLVKGHANTRDIPVIMLSGKDGTFDKLRGRLAGSSDYITKPFDAQALLNKVERTLQATPSAK